MAFNYLEDLKKRTAEKTAQTNSQQTSTASGSASYDYLEGAERKRMTPQPGYNKGTMKSNINPDSPRPGGVFASIAQTKGKETNYGITRKDDLASASAKYKAANPDWKPEDNNVSSGVGAALVGSFMNIYDFPSSLADWAMGTLANTKNRFKNIDVSGKQDSIVGKYAGGGIVRSQQESYDAANQNDPGALSRKTQRQQEAAILRRTDQNDTGAMAEARRNIEKAQKGIDAVTDLENESQLVQYIGQGIQSLPTTLASRLGPAGMVLSSIASFKRSYDQKYDEMEASGKEIDPDKLMTYSIAAAAVEVGSEYIFPAGKSAAKVGYGVLKNTAADNVFANGVKAAAKWLAKDGDEIIVPTLKAFGKSLLKESGQEGAEEVVSYVGQGILAKLLTNQDDEWSSLINTSGAFQSFMGGAVAGLMFSGVAATPGFIQSRQWLKQNSKVPINKLTDDQIRDLFKRAREDYETAEGRQDLNGGLLRTVAKAQSTGQVVQETQSGQAFEVLQPGPDGEVTLLGMDGGTDMTLPAADLQASLDNGLLVEVQQPTATPATAVMTDSSLPVTSGQATPAGVAQAAPVAMTDVTLPDGKTRREVRLTAGGASVRAYQDKSNLIVKIRAGKMMTDDTLTIGLDEIAQSDNLALALETGSNGQLSRIIKNSISPADSAAFVQGVSQAAAAVAADAQQALTAEQQAKAQADAEQQAKADAEQKTEAFRQESEAEAKEIQRLAELGLVAEETASSIAAVNADLARLNIQGRMRPVRLENHTAVMTDIQNIMQEVAGKQIIFVESVGDDRVNEFVNDFSKNTVFVNVKHRKLDDALFAVGHGLHHLMVKDGNGVLFTQTAMKHIPQSEIDTYINGFESEAYRQRLQDSPALVAEELVGDRAGELFKSPKWWKTMAELAPSKKRANIMNQIAAHLEAMGAASETISDDEITAMTEALRVYQPAAPTPSAKAQTTETVNQETKQQTSPDVPKSFMMGKTVQTSVRPNEYIDVQYAIVDVSQLIASHDIAGNENPDYNQDMQPRDRSRVSSLLSIAEIANKIDPKQLVGNETAKNGAPIVGKDGMVESGNSRIIALQESYRLKNSSSNKYRDYIEQNAQEYGIFGSLPANPVLIRVRLTDTDRAEFARLANVSEQAIMSASEQAQSDAKRITNGLLEMFDINANGEINTAANRDFIRRFVADIIPAAERGSVLQDNGQISATGILRIKNAVFFKAYENVNLLEVVSESTDNNIKNIINSMIQIAPLVVKTKAGIERGVLYDMDISGDMAKAVEKYDNLRLTAVAGMDPVESYVKQVKLIPDENMTLVAENLLKVLYLYKGSRKKLISFFADFYNGIDSLGSPQDQNLFGDVYQPNRDAYIDTIIEKELDKYAKAAQSEGSTDPLPLLEYAETAARTESISDQTAGTEARTEPGPAAPEIKQPGLSLQTAPSTPAVLIGSDHRVKKDTQYSIRNQFYSEYGNWDKKNAAKSFVIGRTSDVLKSIGIKDQDIIWDASKIIDIKSKHPGMTDDIIKQVPRVIDNPVLVMESRSKDPKHNRITIFGELLDTNGSPVIAILELEPSDRRGYKVNLIKVASAYGKDSNPQWLIDHSNPLYIDPNKKRTDLWSKSTRLQLPVGFNQSGPISKVSYANEDIKYSLDYRMRHTAPDAEYGAPAYDLVSSGMYPEDVYSSKGLQYYKTYTSDVEDRRAWSMLNQLRGKPEAEVTIYRAVPRDVTEINPGDWVTISKAYAEGHGAHSLDGEYDILSKLVKAKEIYTNGDSWMEWGYQPQDQTIPKYAMRTKEHLGNRNIEKYMSEESQKQLQDYAKVYVPQSNQRTYKNVLDMLTNDYQQTMADAEDVNQASAELTHIRQMLWVLADARQDYVETNRWFYLFNKANEKAGQAVQANVMIDNMALQGNLSYAMQSFDESISKGKKAAVKAATINLAKKFNEIDRAAAPEAVPNQAELQDELGAQIDEAKRKERALKRILGRLDALENKVGEFDADAVSQYIKTLHGVAAVTQNIESLPKTSDPKAFMQYVVKNIDTLQNEWLAAYRIIRNLHGMDEVFMAEIDAYFGDFIPDRRYQHPLPALELTPENYDQIKNAVVAHYSEDFRTFDAMVYELRKLGLDTQNAVLVARMAQKQIAYLTREQKLMAARKILKAGSKTKEEILNKIVNLSNERGIDDQTVQAFIAKTFKLPGLTPELYDLISRNSKTLADIKKNMLDDGRTYMTEQEKRYASILKAEILAAVQREKKSTWLQKVDLTESISLMSNPKTINRNLVGNFGFATIDLGKDYVAAGIDYAISKGTGRRYIPKPVLLKMFKGFKRGAVEAWEDIWKYSIDTSNLDTGWSVPRGDVFTSKFGRTVMKVFRTVMQLPDRAFQAAAFDSQLAGLMKLYDVADVNDVTPEMLEAAQYYASYKTFTDENYLNTSLGKIKSILNFGKAWGIGSIVFKFTHVPASLTMRAIEYSPVSLFKAAYYLARPMAEAKAYGGYGNAFSEKYQRKFANALAEGTFGSLVTIGLGAWLTSLGLMTGRPEDDEDKRKLNRAIGMGRGYMMNWSGLWRVLRTLDPDQAKPQYNDLWSTYSWFSPMNIGISIGANITQDMRKFENDGGSRFDYFTRAGWTSVTSAVESITEMSVLAGLNNFIYNMTNAPDTEKNFLTAMMKTAASVPSNFVPQVVKGLRDLNDNTMRELGSSSDFLQYAINSILNKVPGASKLLPPAESDALGNLREVYEENGTNIWNVFFNPAIMSRYTPNSSALMVLNTMAQMEQQGLEKTNMIPQEVRRNFGYKEIGPTVELTLQEQYDLTSAIRKEVMRRYATIPSQLTLEDKVDRMTKILNEVTKTYKSDMQRKKLKAQGIRPKN